MGTGAIELSTLDLFIAVILVLIAGGVSLSMKLGIEGRLALASIRTVVQLLIVGFILKWVFGLDHPAAVGAVILVMISTASLAAVRRPSHAFTGSLPRAFLSLFVSALFTTFVVTAIIVRVDPWYRAQYVIPLLGMILGNGLTGLSLCMDYFLETVAERSAEIDMELALGASKWEAARSPMRRAIRRGMIPIINTMMVAGIVSLPGMMTGQILQGANPLNAVKYQIVVMFMIGASTSLSSIAMALLIFKRVFTAHHQLQRELVYRRHK